MGKEKVRVIKKGLENMQKEGYILETKKLTIPILKDFHENIYIHFIQEKENPKVCNLIEQYQERIEKGEDITFGYIQKDKRTIAGAIYTFKQKKAGLAIRGYDENEEIQGLKLGYFLEYLFYTRGLEKGAKYFSRGQDRNGYNVRGQSIGVALHKIEQHFIPYIAKNAEKIEINKAKIDKECLIFTEEDEQKRLKKACIWTKMDHKDQEKTYNIIQKRGLEVEIKNR